MRAIAGPHAAVRPVAYSASWPATGRSLGYSFQNASLWVDAGQLTLNHGDAVTTFSERSANGLTVTAAGGSVTYTDGRDTISKRPGIALDGTNSRLTISGHNDPAGGRTVVWVGEFRSFGPVAANRWAFRKLDTAGTALNSGWWHTTTQGYRSFWRTSGGTTIGDSGRTMDRQRVIFIQRYDGTNDSLWANGVKISEQAAASRPADVDGDITIGNHESVFVAPDAIIHEVAVVDEAWTDVEIAAWFTTLDAFYTGDIIGYGTSNLFEVGDTGISNLTGFMHPVAVEDGSTVHWFAAAFISGSLGSGVAHGTATTADPFTITWDASLLFAADTPRGVGACKLSGGDWLILVDSGDGSISAHTGALGSLTDRGVVLADNAAGNEWFRHPTPIEIGATIFVWVDRRTDSATGEEGDIVLYSTPTSGGGYGTWTSEGQVIAGDGVDDIGAPGVFRLDDGGIMVFGYGYGKSTNDVQGGFPHDVVLWTSDGPTDSYTKQKAVGSWSIDSTSNRGSSIYAVKNLFARNGQIEFLATVKNQSGTFGHVLGSISNRRNTPAILEEWRAEQ